MERSLLISICFGILSLILSVYLISYLKSIFIIIVAIILSVLVISYITGISFLILEKQVNKVKWYETFIIGTKIITRLFSLQ